MRRTTAIMALAALAAFTVTGCASSVTATVGSAPSGSPTPTVVVYPPPGTSAVMAGELCQMAAGTAIPLVKRQPFIAACNSALARATDPVTKPVILPPSPITPTSTPAASPCRGAALATDFRGSQEGFGNDFAAIIIRNVGTTTCQLGEPVVLVGLDAQGVPDTQVLRYRTGPGVVLAPGARPVPEGQEVPPGIGVLSLDAEYRDDPTSPNGLCDAHRVVPTAWRLTWPDGTTTTVANRDPTPLDGDNPQLLTCRGELNVAEPISSGT